MLYRLKEQVWLYQVGDERPRELYRVLVGLLHRVETQPGHVLRILFGTADVKDTGHHPPSSILLEDVGLA